MKDPQNEYNFEEVCYDSDDQDFAHEYGDIEVSPVEPDDPYAGGSLMRQMSVPVSTNMNIEPTD